MVVVHPQTDIIFRRERAFEKYETQTHVFRLPNIDCILPTPRPKASKNCEELGTSSTHRHARAQKRFLKFVIRDN